MKSKDLIEENNQEKSNERKKEKKEKKDEQKRAKEIEKKKEKEKEKQLWKLIKQKGKSHQYTNQEIEACGVSADQSDRIREAISKSNSLSNNLIVKFFLIFFSKIGTLLDSVFRVILIIFAFLCSLQFPYVNERAEKYLQELLKSAKRQEFRYQQEVLHYRALLEKYGIQNKDPHDEVSAQIKAEKSVADRWLKYKNKKLESLWKVAYRDFSVLEDLRFIYKSAIFGEDSFDLVNFSLGLPRKKSAYLNSLGVSLVSLFAYLLIQSLLLGLIKQTLYQRVLFFNLKRAF